MPKVKPIIWTPTSECNDVKKNILVNNVKQDMDVLGLSKATGIKPGTMYNRMKDPGDFKLSELCIIARAQNVTLIELIGGGA